MIKEDNAQIRHIYQIKPSTGIISRMKAYGYKDKASDFK